MRRVCETVLIDGFIQGSYRQKSDTGKAQKPGVFRDWYVGLKSLSEKGPLHMGGVKAPLCNLDCPRKSLRRCAGRCDCYLFVNAHGLGKTLLEREANSG